MVVISSREFRQNQRAYLDRVDAGEQVIVQRGKDRSYAVTAVTEEDVYFTPEMVARIKASLAQAERGEVTRVTTREGIRELLGL